MDFNAECPECDGEGCLECSGTGVVILNTDELLAENLLLSDLLKQTQKEVARLQTEIKERAKVD